MSQPVQETEQSDGEPFDSRSTLKFPPADLLERLLQEAGFSSADRYGDWHGDWHCGPFVEAASWEIIIAARCQTSAATARSVRGTG